ncbi:MAG: sulfate adenylyltransferase subunit 1 [Acidimicrobiales bacterium]
MPEYGEILRVAAVGAVDDGKSTLIGRLLHDTGQIPDDHLQAALVASRRRGMDALDLSLITDGLQAERDQGITIDVAHRYFTIPGRKLIVADCPGHLQYTRNMATGSSNADLALVVVDITRGIRQQTTRHMVIASLFGIRQYIIAVNKMDSVSFDQARYTDILSALTEMESRLKLTGLELGEVIVIPVSALSGDNVVHRSSHTPWYSGPTLLAALQHADSQSMTATSTNGARTNGAADHRDVTARAAARLPVQLVIRVNGTSRRYAGMVVVGELEEGQEVVILPSLLHTRIEHIWSAAGRVAKAAPSTSVSVSLADEVGISRGDVIAADTGLPQVTTHLEAVLCWWGLEPASTEQRYMLKAGTKVTRATISDISTVLDIDNIREVPATTLPHNGIGRVEIETASALAVDSYATSRATGSFIIVDESSNATLGAGMVI